MNVLIADDDQVSLYLLEACVRELGNEVIAAHHGAEALALLGRGAVDLIISDALMPEMDGYQLCYEVKRRAHLRHIPFVLYSAISTDREDEALARTLGVSRFIAKSHAAAEFTAVICELIRAHEQGRLAVPAPQLEAAAAGFKEFNKRLVLRLERDCNRLQALSQELKAAVEAKDRESTERQMAEATLRESEARYRAIVESANEGIWVLDREDRTSFVNAAMANMLGYAVDEMLGRHVFEFVDAETQARITRRRAEGITTPVSQEIRLFCKKGREVWASIRASTLFDHAGKRYGSMAMVTDITARKRSEEALRNATALYQSLVDALPQSMFRKDRDGRFTFVNAKFCALVGKAPDAIIGKTDYDFYPPHLADKYRADDRTVMDRGEPYETVEEHRTAQGADLYVRVIKTPLRDDERRVIGIQGIFWDETARWQAEARNREQAELLAKVQDAISAQDVSGRILYWNQGAERLYGWAATEVVGRAAHGVLPDADDPALADARRDTLATGSWHGEVHRRTKAGTAVVVASRWTLVRDAAGKPTSILRVETDVTEKKSLEAESFRTQRIESIGTLASGVAHDLNNILAPILMSVECVEARLPDEEARGMMATAKSCAQRGAYIVKQLLTFARGMGGERTLIEPRHVIREVMQMVRETFPKSLERESTVAPDLWAVYANPTELHQVLLNLCVNARDAMPKGGRLRLRAENVRVDDLAARSRPDISAGAYVRLRVEDTGEGIPPEIMDTIFDPFFTTKAPGKGTGLGLSTVMGIVKSHGGFVQVESAMGNGSAFNVYLPAHPAATASAESHSSNVVPRGNGECVLLVDDEASILASTRTVLEQHGYRVLAAANGAEALQLYTKDHEHISVVVTDIAMPRMDGIALVRSLQRLNPQVRILAATGLVSENRIDELKATGVTTCLRKPYTADVLLGAIRDHLPRQS